MSTELATRENVTELAAVRPSSGLALSFAEMTARVAQLDQFYREVMQEGTDYGKIPGTDKPTLYQPGAQMLDQIFGYAPKFEVMPSSVLGWDRPIPFFHYVVMCRLVSRRSGEVVAEGIGSCNSYEDKYRWRNAKRVCPDCKLETIIKGKQEYGGGWLCFKKNGGCGTKFRDGEAIIEDQQVGRVENEDTASLENTISKMAQKRAHIAATLNATGASRIFTQDIEDLPQFQNALVVESVSRPTPTQRTTSEIDDRVDAAARITGAPPAPQPANAKFRENFEKTWKRGCDKATAIGVVPDDMPGEEKTEAELRKALDDLREAIASRESLNAALLERIALANEHNAGLVVPDPSKLTDAEVHDQIATCDRILDAAEQAEPEDEGFQP